MLLHSVRRTDQAGQGLRGLEDADQRDATAKAEARSSSSIGVSSGSPTTAASHSVRRTKIQAIASTIPV